MSYSEDDDVVCGVSFDHTPDPDIDECVTCGAELEPEED